MNRRPAWLPLVAAVLFFTLFCALGAWQLQRADERRTELAAIAFGAHRAPVALPTDYDALADLAWHPVRVNGRFMADRQLLVDNRTFRGRAGFDVVTPLVTEDGRTVLVNRGWVPADAGARQPAESVDADLPAQQVNVEGRLWLPDSGIALGPAVAADSDWPRMMMRFDFAALESELERELVPAVILATSGEDWSLQARSVTPRMTPERHLGYAFQWFALAFTVLVVTVVLWVRMRRRRGG